MGIILLTTVTLDLKNQQRISFSRKNWNKLKSCLIRCEKSDFMNFRCPQGLITYQKSPSTTGRFILTVHSIWASPAVHPKEGNATESKKDAPWTSMNIHELRNVINVRNGRSIFKTSRGLWWLFLGPKYWKIWKQPISAKAAKICQDMSRYAKICQDAIVLLFGLNETRVGHPEALGFLAPRSPKSISCFLSRPCSISNMSQSETNPHIFTHGFDVDWK